MISGMTDESTIGLNPKGWIEVVWGAALEADEYIRVGTQMIALIAQTEDRRKKPLMLIDFSKLRSMDEDVVLFGTAATRDLNCRKIAGFGIRPEVKPQLDTMKFGSMKAGIIEEFGTREEAEAWLLKEEE